MDMSQLNMNDPQVQALIAEFMRKQQPGGVPTPQQMAMQQTPQAPAAPQLQNGPALGQQMPPRGGTPMGGQGGQLDPELVEQMLALQGQGGQRDSIRRQYALADAMRADSKNQLEGRQLKASTGGSLYVAPSWLNGAVAVGQNLMADKRMRDADARGASLDTQRQAAARRYLSAMNSRSRKPDDEDALGDY